MVIDMSLKAMEWAMKQTCGGSSGKLVLMYLSDRANNKKQCWPSIETIAQECEMSVRSVINWIEKLETLGLISRQKRTIDGLKTSNVYFVNYDVQPLHNDVQPLPKNMQNLHKERATVAHKPIKEPTNNQNYNKRFVDFWNEYPKRNGPNPRKTAYQKFIKLIEEGVCPDRLIAAARQYEKWVIHKKQDRQFVKQAITWLNQECWEDNLSIPKNELKEGFGQRIGFTGGV